jgi:hypothetical protein
MESHDVAVATMTWARSPAEEALLARSLHQLAAADMPVAVADTGSIPRFTDTLRARAGLHLTVPRERGLVAQVQASVQLATTFGRPFILYVEPDKHDFFEDGMQDFLRRAPAGDDVGVVLASRSAASFATFPPMQRFTEDVINSLLAQLLTIPGDYSYGPFLMHRRMVPHVMGISGTLGWGWRHSTFAAAHRAGLRVLHVAGEYVCPPDQRTEGEDERRHRMRQLSQNILGVLE